MTSSEEPKIPEHVDQVERDLLNVIIHELENERMTVEESQQLARDFLALLPASEPTDLADKLANLSKTYSLVIPIRQRHIERWPLLDSISTIRAEKQVSINTLNFDRAIKLRSREKELLRRMQELPPLFPSALPDGSDMGY